MAHPSFLSARLHISVFVAPIRWRSTTVNFTMSLCLSELSAWLTVSVADYILLVGVTRPATRICLSAEYLSLSTSLVLSVLNSSTSELQLAALSVQSNAGETGWVGGMHIHFLIWRLVILSNASITELDMSYSITGQINVCIFFLFLKF